MTLFRFCVFSCCVFLTTQIAFAAEPETINVWPDKIPGLADGEVGEIVVEMDDKIGQRVMKVSKPTLTIYRPAEKKSDAAMIICPGGGYHILALDLEGIEIAKWLNDLGMTAIVLQYRVPRGTDDKHELPMMDAQRSIALVRHRAKELGISPNKIGIMGFSAGGHLTANAATNFAKRSYEAVDEADKQSCRPDHFMLVYPAYMVKESPGTVGEKDRRKKKYTTELVDDLPVSEKTPPGLMIHAADDGVTCNSSIGMFLALRKVGVKSELHVYPDGGHGYGMRRTDFAVTSWPDRAEVWLRGLDLFSSQ